MRTSSFFAAVAGLALAATPALAHNHAKTSTPAKTVVEVAVGAPDFSTLVTAVQAAGLVETLSGKGPFTVFAPTNAAFAKLPAGTVETLVKPENKGTLTTVLTYHVVAGRVNAAQLLQLIRKGGGTATLTTVQGGTIRAALMGERIMLTDAKGGMAHVVAADVNASNGVIHGIDAVLMPQ
jgi:uncharacterized surface protein with fasciclin (FAS1) repeats